MIASGTVEARDGEAIDARALRAWMRSAVPSLLPDDAALSIRQFPAGFSNLTYLVQSTSDAPSASGAFVLRRPPRGARAGLAHDMAREHGILTALHPLGVPVPKPLARCDDESVIGAPFYLMEHVSGVILRGARPTELPSDPVELSTRMRALSTMFVSTLAGLHAVDVSNEPLRSLGRAGDYVARQVDGWTRRWHASRTEHVPSMESVAVWLAAHRPQTRGSSLVHNDFKFDNLVLESGELSRVSAILDWEMATIGDPLMDLGTSLAYWVEANDAPSLRSLGLGVTALPGAARRADLVQMYASASGRDVTDAVFYYVFGLFKVGVIAQQIYARFVAGLTADKRFASLGAAVDALGDQACNAIESNTA